MTPEQIKQKMGECLTAERLREHLDYDLETGLFRRKKSIANSVQIGEVAGGINSSDGYRCIRVDGKRYKAHRLAWLYVHGCWPKEIDHINGKRDDNRIANLREVTRRENGQNRSEHRDGKLVGASYSKQDKKWTAQIWVHRKKRHLGYFETEEDAHNAYLMAVDEMETLAREWQNPPQSAKSVCETCGDSGDD
jgi:hypothetical protein